MPSRRSTESSASTTRILPAAFGSIRQRRELRGEAGRDDLEEPLGLVEAVQRVLAEVAQLDAAAERRARRLGDEHLAAVARLRRFAPPGARRGRRSRRPRASPGPRGCRSGPGARSRRPTDGPRRRAASRAPPRAPVRARRRRRRPRRRGSRSPGRRPGSTVSRTSRAVVGDQLRVGAAVLADDPRRALDVREEEGDARGWPDVESRRKRRCAHPSGTRRR